MGIVKTDIDSCGKKMISWAHDLFPICRSITGDGILETISYIKNIHSELTLITFNTGDIVFDWIIPKEWNIVDAYIEHESGKRFAEFIKHNLHILNYSKPVNKWMSKESLLSHIHTQPDQPDWIPYVTSYYEERWGFCMSENDKLKLPSGKYHAYIDSKLEKGELNVAEILISGYSEKEIFFSTYICHPSMTNNELSGPVLQMALIDHIKKYYIKSKYSYRFIFVPETIGSIAYLSRKYKEMKKNIICGFNLSCVGDNRAYSHIESRLGETLADFAVEASLIGKSNVKKYSFLDRGSDERQYCSPGIDLPVCGFSRSKYGEYPEYHTSADNFDVISEEGLMGSFEIMSNIISSFETCLVPKNTILCEPQLSNRGLYPTISKKGRNKNLELRMNILSYADGIKNVFELAKIFNSTLSDVNLEIGILMDNGLLKNNDI
jgi:aminopeptidase-like protein